MTCNYTCIKYCAKTAAKLTGTLYALFGFVGTFAPIDNCMPVTMPILLRAAISTLILFGFWLLIFILVSLHAAWKKKVRILSANNGHALYLQYGDIFSKKIVNEPDKRRNLVIPVNRCFDTCVDNRIVSKSTLHGIAIDRLIESKQYTEQSLAEFINSQLKDVKYKTLSVKEKPKGNLNRYPIGTVVDLPAEENTHYFLWALSTFDSNLKARTTMLEYVMAVQKLIKSCNAESEGFPVVVPLAGTGLSRIKKNQQDILTYLINAFRLNKDEINCDIHIVVREDLKNELSILCIE